MIYPALNIILRGLTLVARFFFIFFLAKFLSVKDVGYYGLFTATIGYSLYFVGLDFYVYTAREILKTPIEKQGQILKSQIYLSAILYLIFLPIAYAFLGYTGWPYLLFVSFIPILFLEHINQELNRLLIVLSKPLFASALLFVRQGSWAIAAVLLMVWNHDTRTLFYVMLLWGAAGLVTAGIGVYCIYSFRMGGWRLRLDWAWIKKGVFISLAFLVASLSLRGIHTFDRYVLEYTAGIEIVAAYILFFGVASTFMTFMEAGVFSFVYPDIIRLYQAGEAVQAENKIKRLTLVTLVCAIVFTALSWQALPFLLAWIDRQVYTENMHFFLWHLPAIIMGALGVLPQYGLYAQGLDRVIVQSHIAGFVSFGITIILLLKTFDFLAVPVAVNVAFFIVLLYKTLAYKNTLSR